MFESILMQIKALLDKANELFLQGEMNRSRTITLSALMLMRTVLLLALLDNTQTIESVTGKTDTDFEPVITAIKRYLELGVV